MIEPYYSDDLVTLYHGDAPEVCRGCGHAHAGPGLAGICIGCPCEPVPAGVWVGAAEQETQE